MSLGFLLLLAVLVVAAAGQELFARQVSFSSRGYRGTWEYRYGASPTASDGKLSWSRWDDGAGWIPAPQTWNPPGRNGSPELWLRTRLPGPEVAGGQMWVWAVDQIYEVYLEGERIGGFGSFEAPGSLKFAGYQPLTVPLPAQYPGKTLVVRVRSDFSNIGLIGQPVLAQPWEIISSIFRIDVWKIAFGAIFGLVGLVSLVVAITRRSHRAFGSYGYFSLCLGAYCLTRTIARGWLFDAPLAWSFLELLSLNLVPITGFQFMHEMFGRKRRSAFSIARNIHAAYLAIAALAVAVGLVNLWWTLPPYQVIAVIELPVLSVVAIRLAWKGDHEARVFTASFLSFVVLGVIEALRAMGVLPRSEFLVLYWGAAALLLCLAYITARRDSEQNAHAIRVEAQHALQQSLIGEQHEIVEAVSRMSSGDLLSPVAVSPASSLQDVAGRIEALRAEILAKFQELEHRNTQVQSLNRELRRQIEERSRSFLQSVLSSPHHADGDPDRVLEPGDQLGPRYTVVKFLGRGGMGAVYEVERAEDKARLAAKLLLTRGQRDAAARFAREAEILARVDHPNLVSISDVEFGHQGLLCIVMELVQGAPLSEFTDRAGDPSFVLPVLGQIADALAVIHEHGVIHRDIKPSNILVCEGPDGPRVKLADFGISSLSPSAATRVSLPGVTAGGYDASTTLVSPAPHATAAGTPQEEEAGPPSSTQQDLALVYRNAAGDSHVTGLTNPGVFMGTPLYMAPELAGGGKAEPAADIFSLGILACELLTGVHPFDQPSFLVAQELRQTRAMTARAMLPAYASASVRSVIERALSWQPEQRPTAREFRDAIRSAARPSTTTSGVRSTGPAVDACGTVR